MNFCTTANSTTFGQLEMKFILLVAFSGGYNVQFYHHLNCLDWLKIKNPEYFGLGKCKKCGCISSVRLKENIFYKIELLNHFSWLVMIWLKVSNKRN